MDLKLNGSTRILSTAVLTTEGSSPKECPIQMNDDISLTQGIMVVDDDATSAGILDANEIGAGQFETRLSGDASVRRELVLKPAAKTQASSIYQVEILAGNDEATLAAVRKSTLRVLESRQRAPSADSTDGTESEDLPVSKSEVEGGVQFTVVHDSSVLGANDELLLLFEASSESSESVICRVDVKGCAKVGG